MKKKNFRIFHYFFMVKCSTDKNDLFWYKTTVREGKKYKHTLFLAFTCTTNEIGIPIWGFYFGPLVIGICNLKVSNRIYDNIDGR